MENMIPEMPKFTTPEEEISFLRNKIATKEREMRERNVHLKPEEIISDQISRYRDLLPQEVLDETAEISKHDAESIVLNLSPETHDNKMSELLGILEEKGIKNTLTILAGFKDPHLEDDFHRFLVQYIKQPTGQKKVNVLDRDFRGVDMTLYELVLPEDTTEEGTQKNKSLKELISSMEQFFSGMLSVSTKDVKDNYIVLEIANANGSDQFVFYVAVPHVHRDLFERQIISIFSDAVLTEKTDDYNIFNQDGVSVGSYLSLKESHAYPIKTYEAFDHDPMNVLLNSFSKIKKDGEGAAVQVIFSPCDDFYNKKYNFAIEQIEKGVTTKEAVTFSDSIGMKLLKGFGKFFSSPTVPKEGEEKKPIDTEAIGKIQKKLGSVVVSTNIRLVASSRSRIDAEKILHSIESSFNQFTDTTSNALVCKRLEKSSLEKMLRAFSFRSFDPQENMPLNLHELTTLIHFHTTALTQTPQLKQSQSISAPAPSDIIQSGTFLGVNTYRNIETKIYMQDEDRLRHMYVVGQTGTGKTVFLKNMIIQDIQAGKGCCFIDPHGPDAQSILANIPPERYKDVIYFDPGHVENPMALNMLEYDRNHPEQKTFVVNELFSIFQKLYGAVPESMGPMFEQYFRNATMLVIEDPDTGCTLLDVSRVMTNKEFRQLKLSHCKNPIVVQFWTEVAEKAGGEASLANIVPYITSKFDVFLANDIMRPIIAQEKSSFDFRELMDNKKILLVNLSKGRLGDINANLIGLILVGKILMAALSRSDIVGTDFPAFYLYIDEFQNITTNSISTILSEARKYKLSLTIAHQFIAQLQDNIKDAVFGNVGSIATFRVGAEDAEFLEKQFSPVFTAKDIMNIDNLNLYIKMLVGGRTVKAFNITEPYPPKGNTDAVEKLKELSYLTYGGDRKEIEQHIIAKYKK